MSDLRITNFYFNIVDQPIQTNPCSVTHCGPNSQCREINNIAVCSCLPEYTGSPPACRPECVSSSECPSNKACINQKCTDPCPASCGRNSNCRVINHSPHCTCVPGYTGDAFSVCFQLPRKLIVKLLFSPIRLESISNINSRGNLYF